MKDTDHPGPVANQQEGSNRPSGEKPATVTNHPATVTRP